MIKLRIPVQAPLVTGAVNEYPIILSTPMVRAILAGVKRQTRHIVRADNSVVGNTPYRMLDFSAAIASKGAGGVGLLTVPLLEDDGTTHRIVPRWASGDRLWVKEHWRVAKPHDHELGTALRSGPDGERPVVLYEASNVGGVVARGQSGHLNCHAQPLPVWAGRLRRAMSMPQWAMPPLLPRRYGFQRPSHHPGHLPISRPVVRWLPVTPAQQAAA